MSFIRSFLYHLRSIAPDAKIQAQYIDYGQDQWTVPKYISNDLIEKYCNDHSVSLIKVSNNDDELVLLNFL